MTDQKRKFNPGNKKEVALLIDPDKHTQQSLKNLLNTAVQAGIDYLFVGGSLLAKPIDPVIELCKHETDLPVILFPGNSQQISLEADAILFLSLVSGRNPEYLIGQHVQAAPFLKQTKLEVISTAYMLIDGGNVTSVEYVSNTKPIPSDKIDIAVATALASMYMGMRCIYLEAGSGALKTVPGEMIQAVKTTTDLPLIVGGGIRDAKTAKIVFDAGADVVVLGSVAENHPDVLPEICSMKI